MKLKYYLRGLGVGIVVTCILMSISNKNAVADAKAEVIAVYEQSSSEIMTENESTQEETTQEEATEPIILRNEEIESEITSVLDEAQSQEQSVVETESEIESQTISIEIQSHETEKATTEDSGEIEVAIEDESKSEESVIVIDSDEADVKDGKIIEIQINKGDGSGVVAQKLYEAGVVEDAREFDEFLMQNGYDKKLNVGVKVINTSESWQMIADKLIK